MKADVDYKAVFAGATNKDLLSALESFLDAYKEQVAKREEPSLPIDIFSRGNLGVMEAAVKYLKENIQLSYSDMADLLKRDDRTMWVSYRDAVAKVPEGFQVHESSLRVPSRIFQDRTLAPLEALVVYMKDSLHMSFKQISSSIGRSYRTIWLTYRNGSRKRQ